MFFRSTVKPNFLFYSIVIISIFTACKKRNDNVYLVNEGTQGFDGTAYKANFNLLTHTVREDSLVSDSLSHCLLGITNDPVFGISKTTSFVQYSLPQLDKVVSTQTLDSVVLYMQYTSTSAYYGDLNAIADFNVYELTEAMKYAKIYSNNTYTYNPTPIGSYSGKFTPKDSITINELGVRTRIAPTIRIKLSAAFANKMFNASSIDVGSQANFLSFFKGLAFVPTTSPGSISGSIAAFNFLGKFSKIRIYYNGNEQSDFVSIKENRRFTQFEVSNQSSNILKQKSIATFSFDTGYAQSLGGSKLKIEIKDLFKSIINPNKFISIAKAELYIRPIAGSNTTNFGLPARLLALQPSATNSLNQGILDLAEPFYGGVYNSTSKYYKFNITSHIQDLFIEKQQNNKDNNRGLFIIVPTDFPVAPSQIMIDTRKNLANAGIEFKLYYSEL